MPDFRPSRTRTGRGSRESACEARTCAARTTAAPARQSPPCPLPHLHAPHTVRKDIEPRMKFEILSLQGSRLCGLAMNSPSGISTCINHVYPTAFCEEACPALHGAARARRPHCCPCCAWQWACAAHNNLSRYVDSLHKRRISGMVSLSLLAARFTDRKCAKSNPELATVAPQLLQKYVCTSRPHCYRDACPGRWY